MRGVLLMVVAVALALQALPAAEAGMIEVLLALAEVPQEERLAVIDGQLAATSDADERMALYSVQAVLRELTGAGVPDDESSRALLALALSEDPEVRAKALEGAKVIAAQHTPVVVDDSTALEAWEQPIEVEEAWEYADPDPAAVVAADAEHPAPAVNALGEPDRAALLAYERGRLQIVTLTYSLGTLNKDGIWTGGGWERKREPRSDYLREATDIGQSLTPERWQDSYGVVDGLGRPISRRKFKRMTHTPYRWEGYERDELDMYVADYNRALAEELGLGDFDLE